MTETYVLLAETDENYAERLQADLTGAGIPLVVARTAHEARALARQEKPDVVMLDMDQPPREAVRLLGDLRKMGITPPVLWVTSSLTPAGKERAMAAGAQGLLSKKTDATTAVLAVQSVLNGEHFFPETQPTSRSSGVRAMAESERILLLLQDQ